MQDSCFVLLRRALPESRRRWQNRRRCCQQRGEPM